jgi:uncharacterized protein (TIGR02996 family)
MPTEKARNPFRQPIQDDPRDAGLRLVHADWLEERGLKDEAQGERLLAGVLAHPYDLNNRVQWGEYLWTQGRKKEFSWNSLAVRLLKRIQPSEGDREDCPDVVFTRDGVLLEASPGWTGLSRSAQRRRQREVKELFTQQPSLEFIIMGDRSPSDSGLAVTEHPPLPGELGSPVLYVSAQTGERGRVEGATDQEYLALCPFCAADRLQGDDCPHFLATLDNFFTMDGDPEAGVNVEGWDRNRYDLADAIGQLEQAVWSFLPSCQGDHSKIRYLKPTRLRALVENLGAPSPELAVLPRVRGFLEDMAEEAEEEQWGPPRGNGREHEAFATYLGAASEEAGQSALISVYDSGDHYETDLAAVWAAFGDQLAEALVPVIERDVVHLRKRTRGRGVKGQG